MYACVCLNLQIYKSILLPRNMEIKAAFDSVAPGQITDSDFDKHCKFAMTKMIMAIYKGCLQNLQDFGPPCLHLGQFSNNKST